MRSLPSLQTNMLLNSQVLQRELDNAIQPRPSIYPVIGPARSGHSELTLKVKDQLPLHGGWNSTTRAPRHARPARNFNAHTTTFGTRAPVGIQYSFTPNYYKNSDPYNALPSMIRWCQLQCLLSPAVGGYNSVEQQ